MNKVPMPQRKPQRQSAGISGRASRHQPADPRDQIDHRPAGRRLDQRGQATVEAAFLIPIFFLLILILLQPAILLYNRMIMENAAAESCRLLATRTPMGSDSDEKYLGYTKRRLAAIPPIDIFHAHPNGDSWKIELIGAEQSSEVSVHIVNYLKPLPLLAWAISLGGGTNAQGYIVQDVTVSMPSQPAWVWEGSGSPTEWVQQWD